MNKYDFYDRVDKLMKIIDISKLGECNKYNNNIYSELLHFFDIIIECSQNNIYNISLLDKFDDLLKIKTKK